MKDGAQKGALIDWTLAAGQLSRLTGIEFQDGGRINVAAAPGGMIHIDGSNTDGSQFRWDHCKWNNLNGYPVLDTVIGVIDHNEIIVGTKVNEWLFPYGNRWNGGSYGDGSWAAPANWGSSQFLFIEDNTITGTNPTYQAQIIDCYGGARVVMRHNVIRGLTGQSRHRIGGAHPERQGDGHLRQPNYLRQRQQIYRRIIAGGVNCFTTTQLRSVGEIWRSILSLPSE